MSSSNVLARFAKLLRGSSLWKFALEGFLILCCVGCASHRKRANCAEIRYRLDHVQYSPEQHDWIEEEWKECKRQQDSLAQKDAVQYQGIYQQFVDTTSSDSVPVESRPAGNEF